MKEVTISRAAQALGRRGGLNSLAKRSKEELRAFGKAAAEKRWAAKRLATADTIPEPEARRLLADYEVKACFCGGAMGDIPGVDSVHGPDACSYVRQVFDASTAERPATVTTKPNVSPVGHIVPIDETANRIEAQSSANGCTCAAGWGHNADVYPGFDLRPRRPGVVIGCPFVEPLPKGPKARQARGLCRACPTPRAVLPSGKTSALWCEEHLKAQRASDKASWKRRHP